MGKKREGEKDELRTGGGGPQAGRKNSGEGKT